MHVFVQYSTVTVGCKFIASETRRVFVQWLYSDLPVIILFASFGFM